MTGLALMRHTESIWDDEFFLRRGNRPLSEAAQKSHVKKPWEFDATKSPIPAAESIGPFVASRACVSDALKLRQKRYGGLEHRPEATARRKSNMGPITERLTSHGFLRHI